MYRYWATAPLGHSARASGSLVSDRLPFGEILWRWIDYVSLLGHCATGPTGLLGHCANRAAGPLRHWANRAVGPLGHAISFRVV